MITYTILGVPYHHFRIVYTPKPHSSYELKPLCLCPRTNLEDTAAAVGAAAQDHALSTGPVLSLGFRV